MNIIDKSNKLILDLLKKKKDGIISKDELIVLQEEIDFQNNSTQLKYMSTIKPI